MGLSSMNLTGKIAVVTGATGGIGKEICSSLLENGATVIGIHIHEGKEFNPEVEYYRVNIADYEETETACKKIFDKYGRIDILVNNAGVNCDAMTKKMTEEQFDKVININLKGTWNMTHFIGPKMQENGQGSIINIASIVGVYGNVGQSNYCASKSGIIGMTKCWAREFALKNGNVRVNSISPGYIKTKMLRKVPSELLDKLEKQTMLGRLGEPQEIANVTLFLASSLASYITGANINANGGMRL